jgi:DNA-binding transcriptional ArsR family regulator
LPAIPARPEIESSSAIVLAPDVGVELHKSALSHHDKVLREAGITRTIVNGRTREVELRRAELEERFPGLLEFLSAAAAREFPPAAHA